MTRTLSTGYSTVGASGMPRKIGGHGELDAETAEGDGAIAPDQFGRTPRPRSVALPCPDPCTRLVLGADQIGLQRLDRRVLLKLLGEVLAGGGWREDLSDEDRRGRGQLLPRGLARSTTTSGLRTPTGVWTAKSADADVEDDPGRGGGQAPTTIFCAHPRMMPRGLDHVAGHPSAGKLELPLLALALRTPPQERLRLRGCASIRSSRLISLADGPCLPGGPWGVLRHGTRYLSNGMRPCRAKAIGARVRAEILQAAQGDGYATVDGPERRSPLGHWRDPTDDVSR